MALEGPRVIYTRKEEETSLVRALRLAREIEVLLEETSSEASPSPETPLRSTRMARAMAAGLIDELEGCARAERRARLC